MGGVYGRFCCTSAGRSTIRLRYTIERDFNDVAVDIAGARGAFGFDLTTALLSRPR